jgi:hypothetical protein
MLLGDSSHNPSRYLKRNAVVWCGMPCTCAALSRILAMDRSPEALKPRASCDLNMRADDIMTTDDVRGWNCDRIPLVAGLPPLTWEM